MFNSVDFICHSHFFLEVTGQRPFIVVVVSSLKKSQFFGIPGIGAIVPLSPLGLKGTIGSHCY